MQPDHLIHSLRQCSYAVKKPKRSGNESETKEAALVRGGDRPKTKNAKSEIEKKVEGNAEYGIETMFG